MCGIIAAAAREDIVPVLLDGLCRLEYRGYDSSGIALLDEAGLFHRVRQVGKVHQLRKCVLEARLQGYVGIAHTRWATHGAPSEKNAHPHRSHDVMVVHNGIIENYEACRQKLQKEQGRSFTSDTDTEVIAHLIDFESFNVPLLKAVQQTLVQLQGAYSLAILDQKTPGHIIAARSGSPLIIGVGDNAHFVASDQVALLPVTRRLIFLEEGDIADITYDQCTLYDVNGNQVERPIVYSDFSCASSEKGAFASFYA